MKSEHMQTANNAFYIQRRERPYSYRVDWFTIQCNAHGDKLAEWKCLSRKRAIEFMHLLARNQNTLDARRQ